MNDSSPAAAAERPPSPPALKAAAARPSDPVDFIASVRAALAAATFESLVLSGNRARAAALRSVRVRAIQLRGETALSLTFAEATRDRTQNHVIEAGLAQIAALLDPAGTPSFAHATLHAAAGDIELRVSRKGQATLRRGPAKPAAAGTEEPRVAGAAPYSSHDRTRQRRLSLELPIWTALGITDAEHRLVPAMARKWRQIDKFVEIVDHALASLPAGQLTPGTPVRVVDFGCGKGYLTFAVQALLAQRTGVVPRVTGVELRPELVDLCNAAARRCGIADIEFVEGDLRSVEAPAADVVIALHACDTATDHALALGVAAGAQILVCSPCCHKELRPQMGGPRPLAAVFRHGIHLGQEAEMVTDSLRALLLESCGYEASVFEFVSLEHTSKNKMILATRRAPRPGAREQALAQVVDVKTFYGIREQCLETLLLGRSVADEATPQACQTP